MNKYIIYIVLILFFSCKKSETMNAINDADDNQMTVLNIEEFSANGVKSFAHYLYISETDSSDSTLTKIAHDYINGLTTSKPVSVIIFVNSNRGFSQSPEDNDLDEIRKNTFAELSYSITSGHEQGGLKGITRYNRR